jgi:hypothetical protein
MDEQYNDYMFSEPSDIPVGASRHDIFQELLHELEASRAKTKNSKTPKKGIKMDVTKKAFDLGSQRATREFMKSAGIIDAVLGAQAKDPRKALVLGTLATLGMGGLAAHGLTAGAGSTGDLLSQGTKQLLGAGSGLGALLSAAAMGSSAPGLISPTTIEQRLASEVAAKLQNPETMGATVKNLGGAGLAALAVPYALYQLGKKVGENESSFL